MSRRSVPDDAGSAVVGFVLVSMLTTVVFLGVLQVALALHVRATLVDCAAEGARYGALADRTPADGAARARELVRLSLSPRFAEQVEGSRAVVDGLDVVRVEIVAPLPVLGLLGPGGAVEVDGHALAEVP
nr:TadE family protein [uncultured Actinotalea sp.]